MISFKTINVKNIYILILLQIFYFFNFMYFVWVICNLG
jgi:hypothetical protein